MDPFYIYLFLAFALPAAWLELQQSSCLDLFSRRAPKAQEQAGFRAFRDNYVIVFSLMMAGDWLQGPYVYHLYEVYGFSVKDIGLLFIVGFGSSALLGTLVGALADIWGRKRAALLYVATYVASCLTKHSRRFGVLLLGRLLGGTATSLLFSAFEAWAVGAHTAAGYDPALLGDLFTKAVFMGNGLMAILSGLIGNWLVEGLGLGPVAPFDAAALVLLLGGALVAATWGENYGDGGSGGGGGGGLAAQFKGAWEAIRQDERIALLGAMQALFEGSMYTFVFLWTPALSPGGEALPHGFIFAIFMTASLAGTAAAGQLMARMRLEQFMQGVFWLACVSLLVPAAFHLDKAPTNAVAEWHTHQEPLLQRHKHQLQPPAAAAAGAVPATASGSSGRAVGQHQGAAASGTQGRHRRRREEDYGGAKPELLQDWEGLPRRQQLLSLGRQQHQQPHTLPQQQQQEQVVQQQQQERLASWASAEDLQQLLLGGRGGSSPSLWVQPPAAQVISSNIGSSSQGSQGMHKVPTISSVSSSSGPSSYRNAAQSSGVLSGSSTSVPGTSSDASGDQAAGKGTSTPTTTISSSSRRRIADAWDDLVNGDDLTSSSSKGSSSSVGEDPSSSSSSSSTSSEAAAWESLVHGHDATSGTGTGATTRTRTSSRSSSAREEPDSSGEEGAATSTSAPQDSALPGTLPSLQQAQPLHPHHPQQQPQPLRRRGAKAGLSWAGRVQLVAFCVFEVVIGLFWPSMMTLRAAYVPEEERATIINIFRIPLNLFVCIILWKVSEYPLGYILALCSVFLAAAAACTARLAHLTHDKSAQGKRGWPGGPGDPEAPISPVALSKPDGRLGLRGKGDAVHQPC